MAYIETYRTMPLLLVPPKARALWLMEISPHHRVLKSDVRISIPGGTGIQ